MNYPTVTINLLEPGSGDFRTLAPIEAEAILRALEHAKGSRSAAARLLGVGRSTLYRRLNELGLVGHVETAP